MRGEEESGHRHLFGELRESRPTKFQPAGWAMEPWHAQISYHFKTQIPSAFIINSKSLRRCSPKIRFQALQMRQLEWNKLSSCLSSLTQSREQIWCLWSLVNPWSGLWVDWSVEAAFIWVIAGSGVTIGDSLCCHLVHWLLPVPLLLLLTAASWTNAVGT